MPSMEGPEPDTYQIYSLNARGASQVTLHGKMCLPALSPNGSGCSAMRFCSMLMCIHISAVVLFPWAYLRFLAHIWTETT